MGDWYPNREMRLLYPWETLNSESEIACRIGEIILLDQGLPWRLRLVARLPRTPLGALRVTNQRFTSQSGHGATDTGVTVLVLGLVTLQKPA